MATPPYGWVPVVWNPASYRHPVTGSRHARNGGEEFAVMLPDTDLTGAIIAAAKIRTAIADTALPGHAITVTASIGIAAYPDHATTADQLERLADSALYLAKHAGRDRVEIANTTDPPPPPQEEPLPPGPGPALTAPDPATSLSTNGAGTHPTLGRIADF
jgi:hypothetical protein